MGNSKAVGWFKDPKVWNSKLSEIQDIFKNEDESLPIVGNDITRAKLFEILWSYLAERLSQRLCFQPEDDIFLKMTSVLMPLTQIVAYPLSEKKISGLGATTKAKESVEFDDKVLKILSQITDALESIRVTKTHLKYYPPVKKQIKELQEFHRKMTNEYVWAYKREDRFLQICGESIHLLKGSGLKETEIKQIVKEALEHFEKQKLTIYVKSLDRIFNKAFYKKIHSPSFLEDGTNISSYYIKKVTKKKGQ
jgi:hypothetical protein